MRTTIIVISILLAAQSVGAQDAKDAETRFHDAYLLEVVEGKVGDAARVYFELMEAGETPARIRHEARFRFAVCCVLLGRADEGRARLAELAVEPGLPAALEARVEEYRKAVDGIGVGTELEKRLEDLVFELGRTELNVETGAYRDFLILGKAAVPTLKKLLAHPDAALRIHSFRLLCDLNEPGMADAWDPKYYGGNFVSFARYLGRHDGETRRFEARMLEMEQKDRAGIFRHIVNHAKFSEKFVRGLAKRGESPDVQFTCYQWWRLDDWALLEEWFESDDREFSVRAAKKLTSIHEEEIYAARMDPDHLPRIVDLLIGEDLGWKAWVDPKSGGRHMRTWSSPDPGSDAGLTAYAMRGQPAAVLQLLKRLVEVGEKWEGKPWTNPLFSGLADALAASIDERDVDLAAYAELIQRWITCERKLNLAAFTERKLQDEFPDREFRTRLKSALTRMDDAAAERFVRKVFSDPGVNVSRVSWCLNWETRRDIELVFAAWEAFHAAGGPMKGRENILYRTRFFADPHLNTPDLVLPQAEYMAGLVGKAGTNLDRQITQSLVLHLAQLPPETARRILMKAVRGISRATESNRDDILYNLTAYSRWNKVEEKQYRRNVVVPALPEIWEAVEEPLRERVLYITSSFLDQEIKGFLRHEDALPALAEFLREHLADLPSAHFRILAQLPDVFPLEEWVPLSQSVSWSGKNRHSVAGRALAAARAMIEDPHKVNASVLAFIQDALPTDEDRRSLEEQVLKTGTPEVIAILAASLQNKPRSIDEALLEKTQAGLLEKEPLPIRAVTEMTKLLVDVKPSEQLFPAIRAMLGSGRDYDVEAGIVAAKQLGRMDLVPDLLKLLESMDQGLREMAREAIDSILELKRIREEVGSRPLREDGD